MKDMKYVSDLRKVDFKISDKNQGEEWTESENEK